MFRAWKFYALLFEIAMCYEILISIFFWTMLYPGLIKDNAFSDSPWHFRQVCSDHCIPLILLTIDYMFNLVPFCYRHCSVGATIAMGYLVFNLVYTKVTGEPIYPPLGWKSVMDWLMPVFLFIGMVVIFLILKFLTDLKMHRTVFLKKMRGKNLAKYEKRHKKDQFGHNSTWGDHKNMTNEEILRLASQNDRLELLR